MIVFDRQQFKSRQKTSLALGKFDGLHIGHMTIIKQILSVAWRRDFVPAVYIVDKPGTEKIFTNAKKIKILDNLGIEIVIMDVLDQNLSDISPQTFVEEYIVKKFNAGFVCAGENYRFGTGAVADANVLRRLCSRHFIEVRIVPLVKLEKIASSTYIREMLACGNITEAEKYLGRKYE